MALQRTTEPAAEPLTLAEAKLHLKVDHSAEDTYITGLIVAARMDCESRIRRTLMTSGWTLTLDCFPGLIELPMPPAAAVASIAYVDIAGQAQTLSGSAYRLDAKSEPARIEAVGGWPSTADRLSAVTVVYSAGYASADAVPQPIKTWMLLAIDEMHRNRGLTTERPAVPLGFADRLLDSYKVWGC